MTNRVTLEILATMPTGEAGSLPPDQLAALGADLAELRDTVRRYDDTLRAAMEFRYGEKAAAKRAASNKDTGAVRVVDGDFIVSADLPKTVIWDQVELKKAAAVVAGWGEPLDDYLTTEYKMSESKYSALPTSVRKVFEPARTVKPGRQTFKLEEKK